MFDPIPTNNYRLKLCVCVCACMCVCVLMCSQSTHYDRACASSGALMCKMIIFILCQPSAKMTRFVNTFLSAANLRFYLFGNFMSINNGDGFRDGENVRGVCGCGWVGGCVGVCVL